MALLYIGPEVEPKQVTFWAHHGPMGPLIHLQLSGGSKMLSNFKLRKIKPMTNRGHVCIFLTQSTYVDNVVSY